MKKNFVLIIMVLLSCKSQTDLKTNNSIDSKESQLLVGSKVALKFINDYTEFCNSKTPSMNTMDWLNQNQLITTSFKETYKNLVKNATKEDPELGLDFDPIFDAQDFPEKGFELMNCNNRTGYITVKGKDWPDFTLELKVVYQDKKWLVDGAGAINIPEDKRAKK